MTTLHKRSVSYRRKVDIYMVKKKRRERTKENDSQGYTILSTCNLTTEQNNTYVVHVSIISKKIHA